MAKHELPINEFQDLLNVYVANGWFPWKQKIVKNAELDKVLIVQPDSKITFVSHGEPDTDEVIDCSYSVAELFSVESGLHDFVNWKTEGAMWQKDGQSPVYDVGYGFQYISMATMTIGQKMQYFLDFTKLD